MEKIEVCRICGSDHIEKTMSFGSTPLANAFITEGQLQQAEPYFPLDVYFCSSCYLIQLDHVVAPTLLFRNYLYTSSTSEVFVRHFERYAKDVYDRLSLNQGSFVVDIGSNDGILLQPFKKLGVKILGVDPATNIATEASRKGLPTVPAFFDAKLAEEIAVKYGQADVITANNVFAHVHDLDGLVAAVKVLLKREGVFVLEVPYLVDLLEKNLFDTIYHEHLSYFSIHPLVVLFNRHSMQLYDVERVGSHGGSIRVFTRHAGAKSDAGSNVVNLLKAEGELGLKQSETYRKFAAQVEQNKRALVSLLRKLKAEKKSIAGYGAAAKANTLLNYFDIGRDILDYIVDDSPLKQGLYTPGSHIAVVPDKHLRQRTPDYILILAWNFAESIVNKCSWYKNQGGQFIIPVPTPKII